MDDARGAGGRQARRLHRADGDQHRGLPADRRRGRADRPALHDDGDGGLRPRVPLHQGALRGGRAGQAPVPAGQPPQDMDGWPHYWPGLPPMWYATHCVGPMLGAHRRQRGGRVLLRLGHDPRGADRPLRLALRGRDRARQVPGLRPHRAHLPQPLRRRPPVPREHRRLRLQAGVRVDADRGRQARPAHGQAPGARDPRGDRRARLRAAAARGDPALHDQGRLRRRGDAPELHAGRRPRRLAPAPGARVRQRARRRSASRSRTPAARPTGPASACARTSPRSRAASWCACPSSPCPARPSAQ